MSAPLTELLTDKIKREGPISFGDYMEMALYHPEHGYYSAGVQRTGRQGDFLTSCTASPLFGMLIAKQLREMWRHLGTEQFTLVEFGGGNGELCRAILSYFGEQNAKPDYFMIEKNPFTKNALKDLGDRVTFVNRIEEAGAFSGCVFCNELLDNFPVRRVLMKEQLMEVMVDHDGRAFKETLRPAGSELQEYFAAIGVKLPSGYYAEVNLEAGRWLKAVAHTMKSGYLMVIDYGHLAGELFKAERKSGTLRCFYRHQLNHDPFFEPGSQDITTSVNFSALAYYGMREGFTLGGFRQQGPFLKSLGFFDAIGAHSDPMNVKVAGNLQSLTTFLLEDMGTRMKVLVLQKDVPALPLSGFIDS
jgi:SAM-dependent MidA family methyltransferase